MTLIVIIAEFLIFAFSAVLAILTHNLGWSLVNLFFWNLLIHFLFRIKEELD